MVPGSIRLLLQAHLIIIAVLEPIIVVLCTSTSTRKKTAAASRLKKEKKKHAGAPFPIPRFPASSGGPAACAAVVEYTSSRHRSASRGGGNAARRRSRRRAWLHGAGPHAGARPPRRGRSAPFYATAPAIVPVAPEEKQQAVASLPDGPLGEILARVPYRSLCRFKCVSKLWFDLCSSPDIRNRSPQTLTGFFHNGKSGPYFRNLPGTGPPLVDPSLSFLRESYKKIFVDQVSGGLLLCICLKSDSIEEGCDLVVCNPATEEWTVLPPLVSPGQEFAYYVGFDATAPSRFVVFVPMSIPGNDSGKVAIYSSETGQWSYVQSKWAPGTIEDLDPCTDTFVFHNGTMHLPTRDKSVVTVDSEGKVWREIKIPNDLPNSSDPISVGQSQGHLYAWQTDQHYPGTQLYIWVLDDYGTGKWTRKHIVNFSEQFGKHYCEGDNGYEMFAVHPDCNVIFLAGEKKMTVSYNLDNHKLDIIITGPMFSCLPYIPSFAELLSVGH